MLLGVRVVGMEVQRRAVGRPAADAQLDQLRFQRLAGELLGDVLGIPHQVAVHVDDHQTGSSPSQRGTSRRSVIGPRPMVWPMRMSPARDTRAKGLARLHPEGRLEGRDERVDRLASGDREVLIRGEHGQAVIERDPGPAHRAAAYEVDGHRHPRADLERDPGQLAVPLDRMHIADVEERAGHQHREVNGGSLGPPRGGPCCPRTGPSGPRWEGRRPPGRWPRPGTRSSVAGRGRCAPRISPAPPPRRCGDPSDAASAQAPAD